MVALTVLQSWGMLVALGIFASSLAYLLAALTGEWVVDPVEGGGENE